jgi:hypothetical protein
MGERSVRRVNDPTAEDRVELPQPRLEIRLMWAENLRHPSGAISQDVEAVHFWPHHPVRQF